MSINRRGFFKVLGVTGAALATGTQLNASPKTQPDKEFSGVLYDMFRCVGCRSCEYACAEANGIHVVVKPIGPACNLDCAYCFYLEKQALFSAGEDFRMSDEDLLRA